LLSFWCKKKKLKKEQKLAFFGSNSEVQNSACHSIFGLFFFFFKEFSPAA
jgi:hypothetical protein